MQGAGVAKELNPLSSRQVFFSSEETLTVLLRVLLDALHGPLVQHPEAIRVLAEERLEEICA